MKKVLQIVLVVVAFVVAIPIVHLLNTIWVESSYEAFSEQPGVEVDAARIASATKMQLLSLSTDREASIQAIQKALLHLLMLKY